MPELITENGPNAGQRYPLNAPRIEVGRHPDCDIQVDVGAVSRRHAAFLDIGGQYYVEDLNSRNGTFVNNEIVRGRHRLQQGDWIQVCDVKFRFGDGKPGLLDDGPSSVYLDESPQDSSKVMSRLSVVSSASGSIAVSSTAEAKLRALIDMSRSLSRSLEVEEVLPSLLETLFNVFLQADRGFIILRNGDGELIPRHTKIRRGDDDRMIRLSKTIINQVVDSKQAILSTDTMDDQRFELSESIADFRIRSFICAPLIDADEEVLGAIQLDSLDSRNRFREEDLELLASVAGQAGIAVDNANLHDQVVRQRVLERDLELAQQVQRGFLPQKAPELEKYTLHHFYQPADKVGGDYFDYIALPDGRVAVVLADVVGHGMAAALQTAQLSAALKFSLATKSCPAEAIRSLNETLSEDSLDDRFITLVMLVIHPDSDKITIVNAGHMPPLLCRGDETQELGDHIRSVPLLVLDSFAYEPVETTLQPGDHVLIYTDGLNEAMNPQGELYGTDRLFEVVKGHTSGAELVERLVDDVRTFANGLPPKDDMCLVCCSRK